ncbi:MAG TPA: lysylphosphatidylglycerol synthase transmembrane domain-containing protein [Candidatus Binataceae bacterium]|nr:lysylphosphatidylglycerol synthase transmembrane domain-containing protein [Candidatus Binataceae bacterium]
MQIWRSFSEWYRSRSAAEQILLQNLVIWGIAVGLVIYLARGLSLHQLVKTFKHCNLPLFLGANAGSFVIRWLADTFLFATLFTFFHGRTAYREVLPASTAQYFLQAVNVLIADGAMVVFLHQRKGAEWITAGWTMAFQGFVDAILMSALTVTVAILIPWSPIRIALPYAGAALIFLICMALWWMRGRSTTRLGRWLRARQGMRAFRSAKPYHYAVLGIIRLAIYVPNILAFYLYLLAFKLHVPFAAVLGLSPALMFAQSAPVSPSGLGPLQAVMMDGFAKFAPRDDLLAAALGVSIVQLLCRIPMGAGTAGTFARNVLTSEAAGQHSSRTERESTRHCD